MVTKSIYAQVSGNRGGERIKRPAPLAPVYSKGEPPDVRRQQILDYVIWYKREHDGCSPSYPEIGKAVHMPSRSNVYAYLRQMRELGMIEFDDDSMRGLRVPGGCWLSSQEWANVVELLEQNGYERQPAL